MDQRKPYIRIRPDDRAKLYFMAAADGYVMVRRLGCTPFVVPVHEWNHWEELK